MGTLTSQLDDGSTIILEILGSPEAPSVYEYALDLPEGHSLSINADGGADILDADGVPTGVSAAAPWAFDSAGVAVPVSYSVGEGNVLVFTVDHTSGNYAYPIVADPCYNNWSSGCGSQVANGALQGAYTGARIAQYVVAAPVPGARPAAVAIVVGGALIGAARCYFWNC